MAFGLKKIILVFPILFCFLLMPFSALGEVPTREIVIELSNFRLYLYQDGVKIGDYPVAIGAMANPTPVGETRVVSRVLYPTYYPRDWGKKGLSPVPPGPDNPVGTRWLGLSWPNYGIHGTNNPGSIGKAVSDGCIRMFNKDVEELFEMVRIGTPVRIVQKTEESPPPQEQEEKLNPQEQEEKLNPEVNPGLFLVQVGAFENKNNALREQGKLKVAGYTAEIYSDGLFHVCLEGHYSWLDAKLLQFELERLGFNVFIKFYKEK